MEPLLPEGEISRLEDFQNLHAAMIRAQRDRVNDALAVERQSGKGLDKQTSIEMRRLNTMVSNHLQGFRPEKQPVQPATKKPGIITSMILQLQSRSNRKMPKLRRCK